MTYVPETKFTFGSHSYEIVRGDDGFYSITRDDGKSLGCAAAFHGATYACSLDAFPSPPRRSLRIRPE